MNDELREALAEEQIISQFKEGEISFQPTYKYDTGTHNFDTSRKQRVPSWTDRILYMDDGSRMRLLEYGSVPGVSISDHKPVIAMFEVTTKKVVSNHTIAQLQSEYFQR